MDDPVLQLHQFRLQAEQLAQIGSPVERRLVLEIGERFDFFQPAEIVDLHLVFFIEAVFQLGVEPRQ